MKTKSNMTVKPNKQKIDWEKTFDKNWINPWERNNFGIPKAHLDIKDFISKLLQRQRKEIIKEIEGVLKHGCESCMGDLHEGCKCDFERVQLFRELLQSLKK